jgi:hypothetical protein
MSRERLDSLKPRLPHAPHVPELPRVGRRKEHIYPATILGRVSSFIKELVKLRANNLRYVAHPFARMAKATESCRHLRWPPKASSLGAYFFTKDLGNATQCSPLRAFVPTLVHDPTAVSHELLKRIRVEEHGRTMFSSGVEPEHLAKSETLLTKERLPLVQSTPYSHDTSRVESRLVFASDRNHVIAADGRGSPKCLTAPSVDKGEDSEGQRSPHKAPPFHGNAHYYLTVQLTNGTKQEDLLPVSFGERLLTVNNTVLSATNAKAVGADFHERLGKPSAAQAAQNGPDCIVSKPVSRLSQISTKVVLVTTQVPRKAVNLPVLTHARVELPHARVSLTQNGKDCLTANGTCSKDTGRRDGNDTHLTALLTQWCSDVRNVSGVVRMEDAEVFHRQQGSVTLQNLRVLILHERTLSNHCEQPVKETVLPWESGTTTGGFKNPLPHLRPEEIALQIRREELSKVLIVAPFRARGLLNSVLTVRCVFPRSLSQRIPEPHRYTVLKSLLDTNTHSVGFGNITGMVQQTCRSALERRRGYSTRGSGESQNTTRLLLRQPPEPLLSRPGKALNEFDFPLREAKITKGHGQVFHLVRHPIDSARHASCDPLAYFPATMLLRNTGSNKTGPKRLPKRSWAIDFTPMGLLTAALLRRGTIRGTY